MQHWRAIGLLTLLLLLICVPLRAATLPPCTPSRACALERAKLLVLQDLAAASVPGRKVSPELPAAVQLLSTLIPRDPQEYRSGFARTVLDRAAAAGIKEKVQDELARSLIAQQHDAAALGVIVDIEDLANRDPLYQDMAVRRARARRFEIAHWAASRMRASAERDQLLLVIADNELLSGLTTAATQTVAAFVDSTREQPPARDHALGIQAQAAARRGDARGALELSAQIAEPEPFAAALKAIAELQIKNKARAEALATVRFHHDQLRRGRAAQSDELVIAERLSQLGAAAEALKLARGSQLDQARTLAAIAIGAARDERFEEALRTLEKIPSEQRAAVKQAANLVAQLRALAGVDLAAAFDTASSFSPLPARERIAWVRDTALQLVRMTDLPRARDALNYEVEIVVQEPECTADCTPTPPVPQSTGRCGEGFREEGLCDAAVQQARFGFVEDANHTATLLGSDQARITVLLAIAEAEIVAGRTALARRTFSRSLMLARLPANNDSFDKVIKTYADWVATDRSQHDALADLYSATLELLRLDKNAACRSNGASLAVAFAHATAGQFATAFSLAETQLQCQRTAAYVGIYARGQP